MNGPITRYTTLRDQLSLTISPLRDLAKILEGSPVKIDADNLSIVVSALSEKANNGLGYLANVIKGIVGRLEIEVNSDPKWDDFGSVSPPGL